MPALNRHRARKAATVISSENQSKRPLNGSASVASGHITCQAKNTARLITTPTTAAVMPVSGAVNFTSWRVASTIALEILGITPGNCKFSSGVTFLDFMIGTVTPVDNREAAFPVFYPPVLAVPSIFGDTP